MNAVNLVGFLERSPVATSCIHFLWITLLTLRRGTAQQQGSARKLTTQEAVEHLVVFFCTTRMSLRWLQLKTLLRPHMSTQVDVVQMLTRLCWFQDSVPLTPESRLPATLSVYVLPATRDPSQTPPRSQWDVPMQLWTAVLPWECARGLSGMEPASLLPPTLLAHAQRSAASDPAPPVYPSCPTLAGDGEGGMLFVQDTVDVKQPTCFWSGAITMPIDVMFLQRVDPFSGTRLAASKAIGAKGTERLRTERSLRADGLQLVAVDYQKLEPFPRCDKVQGTALTSLFPDLYSNNGNSVGQQQQQQQQQRRATEATSRANSIALVLETRRTFIRDHVTHAVSHAPRIAPSSAAAAPVDTSLLLELKLSDDIHNEIEEKRQLQDTMVVTLEAAIRSELARLNHAVDTSQPSASKTPSSGGRCDGVDGDGTAQHSGGALVASRDADADVPADVVQTSFVGRRTHSEGSSNNNSTSARKQARYPAASPGYFEQPKLDYPLVVLSFKLGLCVADIMALGNRMVRELEGGLLTATDVAWLLHLVDDPSLVVPDELTGAIRMGAQALDVRAKHPLTCDWEAKVASFTKRELDGGGGDEGGVGAAVAAP